MNAVADNHLTDLQRAFVGYVVEGIPPSEAAAAAGYAPANAGVQASQLMRKAHVQTALLVETRRRFAALAPVALEVLRKIMSDDTAPKGVRVDAAKAVLDRGGFPALRTSEGSGGGRGLNEMTIDELREFVAKGEAELCEHARLIGPGSETLLN
jgi:hypothetical protein